MSMTWFILLSGKGIGCENGRGLYRGNGDSKHSASWYVRDDNSGPFEVTTDYALSLLAALGYRWDGTAIVPMAATPATPGLTLTPVDLSKPAKDRQVFLAWNGEKGKWVLFPMSDGESWQDCSLNRDITHAYGPLPERPQ